MPKRTILAVVILLMVFSTAIAQTNDLIIVDEDIQLQRLEDSIYVHITWHELAPYGRFASNGMILIKDGQALMIDTPMDNEKTERLVTFLHDSLSADLTTLIIGHFHGDCMGGLEYLQSIGVESIASALTVAKCKEIGLPVPSQSFKKVRRINFNGEKIVCRFFGGGHSFDNITAWLPEHQLLFGGCLIKSMTSRGLGNLSDAVVSEWDGTVENVMRAYPNVKVVVPGHGALGGKELLSHTIDLVKQYNMQ